SSVNAATEATTDKSDKTDKTDASEGSDKDKVEAEQAESVANARDTADVKEAKAVEATGAKEASKVETTEKSESAKDVAKSEKDKKAAKKAEKEKKKKEQLIELAPKFEKSVGLSFGSSSFADQVPESYASETEEVAEVVEEEDDKSTMTTDEEANRRTKQARKAPAQAHESDEIGLDGDDEDEEAARSTHKKSARPSNITGTIDPALIRAMLVKDNKKFGNGSNDKNNRKPAGRTVVNSSQFYGGQNANANKNNANHSGTNFKKVKRNKQTPAERAAAHPQASEHKRVLKIADSISVGALANDLGVKANEVIRFLMKELGMMVTVNQTVDVETAELVAAEYGFTVQDISFNEESFTSSKADKPEDMELRAPIVTVMGHVDHGKT
ncbi:MAG: translation initiation factor IF-2 N-terminal domain-containing protein, partial [Bradymonadales bacterium]|nr:translation initiation factor IF-2 N-terminal domain-containing protein [Bradymonadales bacterium]